MYGAVTAFFVLRFRIRPKLLISVHSFVRRKRVTSAPWKLFPICTAYTIQFIGSRCGLTTSWLRLELLEFGLRCPLHLGSCVTNVYECDWPNTIFVGYKKTIAAKCLHKFTLRSVIFEFTPLFRKGTRLRRSNCRCRYDAMRRDEVSK